MAKPPREIAFDATFLLILFDAEGTIQLANVFQSHSDKGRQADMARAIVSGAKKHHVYRVRQGEGDDVEFERVT